MKTTPRLYDLSKKERFNMATRYVKRSHSILSVEATHLDTLRYKITYVVLDPTYAEPQQITDIIDLITAREYNNLYSHFRRGRLGRVRGITVFYSMNIFDRTRRDYN